MEKILPISKTFYILLCFVMCFNDFQYNRFVKQTKNDKNIYSETKTYLLERENNIEEKNFFRVEVRYPQIENIEDTNKSNGINQVLRNIAFSSLDQGTYDETILSLEEEIKDKSNFLGVFIDHKILNLNEDYISLIFTAEEFNGRIVYTEHYLSTIDLKSGQYIQLHNLIELEQLIKAIKEGNYEIFEGDYSELHNSNEIQKREEFIEIMKKSIKNNDNISYDRLSSENIGLDNEFLYIYFRYENSLNGYIILKIPLQHINLKV